ncbi:mitochondrial uncoupling protein 4 isoform X4 [Cyanistes caeruleus]|uniref:mitochondrial uncoupling protein 4 isoform X4 n=1 Tax=Cyanistes caeruleus TaxID=156563 RepID=UPI000CDB60A2|nr:mitochondrial uncoupling protein 4 isoform X4 [Cyanistes caeruleus]
MSPAEEEKSLPLPERWPRASKFALSACAAAVAELVTFPLDLTKTRLQMQGEAAERRGGAAAGRALPHRGMLRTALAIAQEEGVRKLWQGATPAVYRHIVYTGVRMVTYEHLRDSVLGRAEGESFPLWKAVVGGMSAGAIGQFFASPTDLVKVQMQMEGKRKLEGKPLRFWGMHHAFLKILSEGGVRGLWAGWVPNVQRAALVNMGVSVAVGSACSGLVAAVLETPADVVKTRIMNQPRDKQGRHLGRWYSGLHMNKSDRCVELLLFKTFTIHRREKTQKAEFSFHKVVGSHVQLVAPNPVLTGWEQP